MSKVKFEKYEDLIPYEGKEVAVSDSFIIPQELITAFGTLTNDEQWIHNDVERCLTESQYKKPVAHGFLILSMVPSIYAATIDMPFAKTYINCAIKDATFIHPILANDSIHVKFSLDRILFRKDFWQITWNHNIFNQDDVLCVKLIRVVRRYI